MRLRPCTRRSLARLWIWTTFLPMRTWNKLIMLICRLNIIIHSIMWISFLLSLRDLSKHKRRVGSIFHFHFSGFTTKDESSWRNVWEFGLLWAYAMDHSAAIWVVALTIVGAGYFLEDRHKQHVRSQQRNYWAVCWLISGGARKMCWKRFALSGFYVFSRMSVKETKSRILKRRIGRRSVKNRNECGLNAWCLSF